MRVTETKPVPIYEATCSECKSRIEYKAAEVSFTGYIKCPVCGKSVYAGILCPVGYEYPDASFSSSEDGNDEAIYKRDALKIASEECQEFRGIFGRIEDRIKELPPIEPSRR